MNNEADKFLVKLKEYMSGNIQLSEVEKEFNSLDMFHQFHHYLSDVDIRNSDETYAAMQNERLSEFVTELENKDYAKANEISFLE